MKQQASCLLGTPSQMIQHKVPLHPELLLRKTLGSCLCARDAQREDHFTKRQDSGSCLCARDAQREDHFTKRQDSVVLASVQEMLKGKIISPSRVLLQESVPLSPWPFARI